MSPGRVCYIWSRLMNWHTFSNCNCFTWPCRCYISCFNIIRIHILTTVSLTPQRRIYMISMGSMVIGSNMLQSHLLSTTTMKRLLLGICWITKDLPITAQPDRRRKMEKEEGRRDSWEWGLAGSQAAWVWCKFPCVSRDLCYESSLAPLAEKDWRDSTGCMSRAWSISLPAVNKHTATQTDSHQHTHT